MRTWPLRRWVTAGLVGIGAAAALGAPSGLFPNPWVAPDPSTPAWSRPALAAIAVLTGLLLATFLEPADGAHTPGTRGRFSLPDRRRLTTTGAVGAYVLVCPTCTAVVGLALGAAGASSWLAPAQPVLALLAVALLAEALRRRLRTAGRCELRAEA